MHIPPWLWFSNRNPYGVTQAPRQPPEIRCRHLPLLPPQGGHTLPPTQPRPTDLQRRLPSERRRGRPEPRVPREVPPAHPDRNRAQLLQRRRHRQPSGQGRLKAGHRPLNGRLDHLPSREGPTPECGLSKPLQGTRHKRYTTGDRTPDAYRKIGAPRGEFFARVHPHKCGLMERKRCCVWLLP